MNLLVFALPDFKFCEYILGVILEALFTFVLFETMHFLSNSLVGNVVGLKTHLHTKHESDRSQKECKNRCQHSVLSCHC